VRVLVAEDDQGLRSVLVRGLQENDYVVDAVGDGEEALKFLRSYEYELAVLDWRMPGISGLDVVRWMRRRTQPARILMLTARDQPADRVTGLDAGADDLPGQHGDQQEWCPPGSAGTHSWPGARSTAGSRWRCSASAPSQCSWTTGRASQWQSCGLRPH